MAITEYSDGGGGGGKIGTGYYSFFNKPNYYTPTDFWGLGITDPREMAQEAKMDYWNQTGELAPWQLRFGDWFSENSMGAIPPPPGPEAETIPQGGGGGGGPVVPPPITWSEKYGANGAPDWWRGLVPSRYDPQTEYATMLNSMLPYMSPEDQRYTASVLYRLYPKEFSLYNPEKTKMPAIPGELTSDERREMTSRNRAKELLGVLEKVKQVSGKDAKFGPGYNYLRQLGSVMKDFGGKKEDGQTRQQRAQMMGALDPLAAETQGSQLSAYSALTRMITQPYYTAGEIAPTTQLQNGKTVFGGSIPGYH